MTIHYRTVATLAASALVICALAGCAPAATSPGAGSTNPGSSTGNSQPPAAAGLTGLPKACPSASLVSAKLAISAPTPSQDSETTALNCMYLGGALADDLSINFSTTRKLSKSAAEAALKTQGSTPAFSEVQGAGDFAFYDQVAKGGSYLAGSSGPVAYHIVVAGSESKQQLIDLAQAILSQ
jgi:hypothetical protein